jgi:hypothetical protein
MVGKRPNGPMPAVDLWMYRETQLRRGEVVGSQVGIDGIVRALKKIQQVHSAGWRKAGKARNPRSFKVRGSSKNYLLIWQQRKPEVVVL